MELLSLFSQLPRPGDGGHGVITKRKDIRDFVTWGMVGFVGLGMYKVGTRICRRNEDPCCDLIDSCVSLNSSPAIRDAFIEIQTYRSLNPWLFKLSLQNIDHLLYLESSMLSGSISPVRSDKALAFSFFRMAVVRLNMFQLAVKESLGKDHALVVNIHIKDIYTTIQKHLLNVLHMCSQFKPHNLKARAEAEIAAALEQYSDGRPYKRVYSSTTVE